MARADQTPGLEATLAGAPPHPPRTATSVPSLVLAPTLDGANQPSMVPLPGGGLYPAPPGWDRYEILGLLGRGGMGAVYQARDRRLGRIVALKFIRGDDAVMIHRFVQEARAQSRIDHPGICKVYEVGEVDGKPYIAMQLVSGHPLDKLRSQLTIAEKVQLMRDVAIALHAAHELGIIHRDIKPSNIMVEQAADGAYHPVVMDFGLAHEAGEGKGLTESGAVLGTPAYMSPEQARGDVRRLDRRSDVYGIGATLYDALAGKPPFDDESVVKILFQVVHEEPLLLRRHNPRLPLALELIASKCLNKEPQQRYATAQALAEDLDRYLSAGRVEARRLGYAYRLRYWAQHNRAQALLVLALGLTLLGCFGYGVRNFLVNVRNEVLSKRRAALSQKLGQAVKDLEWLLRGAYLSPLHDTSHEKSQLRAKMVEIEREMRSYGDLAAGLDHYALGRGHLALQEWDSAQRELKQAERQGVSDVELDYALGRVLGEIYRRGLDDARKSGDRSFLERRKKELEKEYLEPARLYLERSRGLSTVPASYLAGLIDFYNQRYDAGLLHAHFARRRNSWLYEAVELEGDIFLAQAAAAKDAGDNDQAERNYQQAVDHYEQAAEIGRSDPHLYEALAESWIRLEELDLYRGRNPSPKLERALAAAERAIAAAPEESGGYTKQAFAFFFQARYAQEHGASSSAVDRLFQAQIASSERALRLLPTDAYAHEIAGVAYSALAQAQLMQGGSVDRLLEAAFAHFEKAILLNPKSPWVYNDYGAALGAAGSSRKQSNQDPQELFGRAIEMFHRAIALDDRYLIAYVNLAGYLSEQADWRAEHGGDAESCARESAQWAERALQINKQNPLAHGNAGNAWAILSSHRLDTHQDGREAARQAVENFTAMLAVDQGLLFAHGDLARSYLLLASHERVAGLEPTASLEAGLRSIARCYRIEVGNPYCTHVEAQLTMEKALWLRQRGGMADSLWAQAARLAKAATQKAPANPDLWRGLAQISLARAEATPALGRPQSLATAAAVATGLAAIERALQLAPAFPRSLALRGALYLHRAQSARAADEKRGDLLQAQQSLTAALQGNPALRNRYESFAQAAVAPHL